MMYANDIKWGVARAREKRRPSCVWLVVGAALFAAGCAPSGIQLTKERAPFDLNCPADKVQVTMISGSGERNSGSVFGARGCGKKATYVRTPKSGVVMNSEIQKDK